MISLVLLAVVIVAAMPGLSMDENDTESGGAAVADIEVAAIPVFPTLAAGAAAIGASVLGYLGVRRRG